MLNTLSDFSFIDVHYHCNPDLYQRRYDPITAGKYYQHHGGAVVLKSHLGSTAQQASVAQAEGLPVFPSIVLNDIAGGLNYRAVLAALLNYKSQIESRLLVHLPTITGRAHHSVLKRDISSQRWQNAAMKPLTASHANGQLKPACLDLIKLANDEPIVLSTGHASKAETYALIDTLEQYPNARLMLNQPANPMTGLKAADLEQIGTHPQVTIEQTLLTYLLKYQDELDLKTVLTSVGNVVYSSDLGQTSQMDINAYIDFSYTLFNQFKLPKERVVEIWKTNPIKMLSYT